MVDQVDCSTSDRRWQLGIVARMRRGDVTALMELYDRTAPPVFGHALTITQDRAEALRITRQAFLKVWELPILLNDLRVPPVVALAAMTSRIVDHRS